MIISWRLRILGSSEPDWRRLQRVKIQELLTASLQNILSYIRNLKERSMAQKSACRAGELQATSACRFKYDDGQMLRKTVFYLNWVKITA